MTWGDRFTVWAWTLVLDAGAILIGVACDHLPEHDIPVADPAEIEHCRRCLAFRRMARKRKAS